ncbi:unnamed protein product [Heterobilharzia americana]|nr:unnamed protein product [Heterobilharzia americana]
MTEKAEGNNETADNVTESGEFNASLIKHSSLLQPPSSSSSLRDIVVINNITPELSTELRKTCLTKGILFKYTDDETCNESITNNDNDNDKATNEGLDHSNDANKGTDLCYMMKTQSDCTKHLYR